MTSPYRGTAAAPSARFVYWPRVGIWPIVLVLAVALPAAWLARRDARAASTVTCSTAAETEWSAPCLVHDSRSFGPPQRIACQDAPAALETFLDAKDPFARPFVTGTVADLPATPASVVPATRVTVGDDHGHAYPLALYQAPAARSGPPAQLPAVATDAAGGIAPDDARAVLASCIAQSGTTGPGRTVALAVFERHYETSAAVLGGALLVVFVWMLARRVRVSTDACGELAIVERGLLLERRRASLAITDVERVRVAAGASGPLHASRVEIVRRDGGSVPLTESFVPLTSRAHERAAARLAAILPTRA